MLSKSFLDLPAEVIDVIVRQVGSTHCSDVFHKSHLLTFLLLDRVWP